LSKPISIWIEAQVSVCNDEEQAYRQDRRDFEPDPGEVRGEDSREKERIASWKIFVLKY